MTDTTPQFRTVALRPALSDPVEPALLGHQRAPSSSTLGGQLRRSFSDHADQPAIRLGDRSHTYAQHAERVVRLADSLERMLGIEPGARFAVLALNSIEYVELYHASLLGGGIINPLNIRLAAPEIAFILNDSGTEVLFVDPVFAPMAEAIRDEVPSLRSVVIIGGPAPDGVRIDTSYDTVVASGHLRAPDEPQASDLASVSYTGGTTGMPKGVVHTQHTLSANVDSFMAAINTTAGDIVSLVTPAFHAASLGAVVGAFIAGLEVVVLPAFTPHGALELVEANRVSVLIAVPVMVRMMLDEPSYEPARLATLRVLGYGGAPMPRGLLERILTDLPTVDIVQGYGMTEGLFVSVLSPDDHRSGERLASAGSPQFGVDVRIEGEHGTDAPTGTPGEVCVRSRAVMHGYWNQPDATAEAFRDGWYHTGDVAYLDDEGYLFLVDRTKDMIVSGGENVYSAEVESALSTHPAVADVAVIGIPNDVWGESVHAVVVRREGTEVFADELVEHARARIAGYKVPRSIEFHDGPLPLSGAGKTLKRALREPYWSNEHRRIS